MIYAMSDIHGCIGELQKNMEQVDLGGDNRIVFCETILIMVTVRIMF